MTPFDLRLWRHGLCMTQAQAARALGISEATSKRQELADTVSPLVALATQAVTTAHLLRKVDMKHADALLNTLKAMYHTPH